MNALRRAFLYPGDLLAILRDPSLPEGSRSQIRAAIGRYTHYLDAGGDSRAQTLKSRLEDLPHYKGVKPPPDRPLTADEYRRLEAAIAEEAEPLATVLYLLCNTGLRVTVDLGGLERRWVEEAAEYGTLNFRTKGGDYHQIPCAEHRTAFRRLLKYKWAILWQAVSTSERGYYMRINRALRRCTERADLDVRRMHPHLLRSTAAVHLLKAGVDVTSVQKRLGHKQLTTTQVYVRYVEMDQMQADDSALRKFRLGEDAASRK